MFAFLRRLGGTVRYEQPIAEPHRDDLDIIPGLFPPVPPAVTRQFTQLDDVVERRIRLYDDMIRELHDTGDTRAVDVLLDARNRIRPPRPAQVPVIPGRSS